MVRAMPEAPAQTKGGMGMSITRHRRAKDATKKQRMEWSEKVTIHYVNSSREITRKAMKYNRILRTAVWIMGIISASSIGLVVWKWQ
jgi:hypothetical protein